MNKFIKRSCLFALFLSCIAQAIGGNITPLRPGYTDADLLKTSQSANYLAPGSMARFSVIWWEIFGTPDSAAGNYRGLDKMLEICRVRGLKPVILLQPSPHPSSPWQAGNNWWLPNRSAWDRMDDCNDALVKHVLGLYPSSGSRQTSFPVYFQLANEPAGKMENPPRSEKPGGSNQTKFGEWTEELHEILFREVNVLLKNGVPISAIVTPSISCINEGNKREAMEWLSFIPPTRFNWLKSCGNVALHLYFSASWAGNDEQLRWGFQENIDFASKCVGYVPALSSKKVIVTECYVTPAGCGNRPIGADLNPYRQMVVDMAAAKKWSLVVWGLLPDENDGQGNPWLTYGGWGHFINPATVEAKG